MKEVGGEGKEGILPALLLAPFSARSLTLVPCSLLLNRTETLATQATRRLLAIFFASGAASQAENLVPLV